MIGRRRLLNRRAHDGIEITHHGQRFHLGFHIAEDGLLAEVFIQSEKASSDLAHAARDIAVLLSIALQSGVRLETIRAAVSRDEMDQASGLLGATLDALARILPQPIQK